MALADEYASGARTPLAVAEAALSVAASDTLNAIASVDVEGTLRAASESSKRWAAGEPLGPLDGTPITFKDSFHVTGLPRWHGTAISSGPVSGFDAAPVRRAREAGMLVVGKTTMPDFAMLMSGLSSQHGVIRNAWDPSTNTGGSSAGAGGSVVTGVATIAVGTDMIGSVRLPAALSGLASLKPTQGRIAYDPAGDYRSAGPMARTVSSVEAALEVLGQYDPVDMYALPGRFVPPPAFDLAGRTVGVLRSLSFGSPVDEPTARAVSLAASALEARGAKVVEWDDLDASAADYEAIYWFMIEKGLPDYLGQDAAARGRILPEIGRMLEAAFSRTAVDSALGLRRIALATERFRRQLAGVDYLLSPALPVRAFPATWLSPDPDDPMGHMGFACWPNRLGTPAGTVPVLSLGLGVAPVSVQIVGQRFDDGGVFGVLRLLEEACGFAVGSP
jgi:aspartyl-tRNA(Asn)/glutamyl-tRNA(Gln) amidotransferase subunit A